MSSKEECFQALSALISDEELTEDLVISKGGSSDLNVAANSIFCRLSTVLVSLHDAINTLEEVDMKESLVSVNERKLLIKSLMAVFVLGYYPLLEDESLAFKLYARLGYSFPCFVKLDFVKMRELYNDNAFLSILFQGKASLMTTLLVQNFTPDLLSIGISFKDKIFIQNILNLSPPLDRMENLLLVIQKYFSGTMKFEAAKLLTSEIIDKPLGLYYIVKLYESKDSQEAARMSELAKNLMKRPEHYSSLSTYYPVLMVRLLELCNFLIDSKSEDSSFKIFVGLVVNELYLKNEAFVKDQFLDVLLKVETPIRFKFVFSILKFSCPDDLLLNVVDRVLPRAMQGDREWMDLLLSSVSEDILSSHILRILLKSNESFDFGHFRVDLMFSLFYKLLQICSREDSSIEELSKSLKLLDQILPDIEEYLTSSSHLKSETTRFLVTLYPKLLTDDLKQIVLSILLLTIETSSAELRAFISSLEASQIKDSLMDKLKSASQPTSSLLSSLSDSSLSVPELGHLIISCNKAALENEQVMPIADKLFEFLSHDDSYIHLNAIQRLADIFIHHASVLDKYLLVLTSSLNLLEPQLLERLVEVFALMIKNAPTSFLLQNGNNILQSFSMVIQTALQQYRLYYGPTEQQSADLEIILNEQQILQFMSSILACLSFICEKIPLSVYQYGYMSPLLSLVLEILDIFNPVTTKEMVNIEIIRSAIVLTLHLLKGLHTDTIALLIKDPEHMKPILAIYKTCKNLSRSALTLDSIIVHHATCLVQQVDVIMSASFFLEI